MGMTIFAGMQSKLSRVVLVLYLTTLALLPWTWFPPFPWLHEHAQWSDAVFAATATLWFLDRVRTGKWSRFTPAQIAVSAYLVAATLSLLFAAPDQSAGARKLLGIGELCALALITSDLASCPRVLNSVTQVLAISSLLVAAAGVAGLLLFYGGIGTNLIGIYGELTPSNRYARIQAGFYNPNLLANFCIFASAIIARRDAHIQPWLRRAALAGLWIAVALTFSRGILGFILAAIIRHAHTRERRRFAVICAVLCVGVIASFTLWKPALDPTQPFSIHFDTTTQTSRYQALTSALHTVVRSPFWGSGPGTHPGFYLGQPFDAHMTLVNIAATLGLPALAVFAALMSIIWRKRSRPVDLALWGGFVGLALDGLGQDIEDFRHLWVMIGLASVRTAEENTSDNSSTDHDHYQIADRNLSG